MCNLPIENQEHAFLLLTGHVPIFLQLGVRGESTTARSRAMLRSLFKPGIHPTRRGRRNALHLSNGFLSCLRMRGAH